LQFLLVLLILIHESILLACAVLPLAEVDTFVAQFTKDLVEGENVVYEKCVQVHPWLLKREFVEDVGYYDPQFAPHVAEDDDLYLRMLRAGWLPAAIRVSVPIVGKRRS
jgi:hypothetical protein